MKMYGNWLILCPTCDAQVITSTEIPIISAPCTEHKNKKVSSEESTSAAHDSREGLIMHIGNLEATIRHRNETIKRGQADVIRLEETLRERNREIHSIKLDLRFAEERFQGKDNQIASLTKQVEFLRATNRIPYPLNSTLPIQLNVTYT